MSSLFLMITITDRRSTDGFLQLYKSHGVTVSMRTVGSGTAVQETLSTLGLEKTEKAVLLAVVTAESWQKIQKDLRRKMQIDVPGTGIAFIVPLSSIGGKRALMFLTEHQPLTWKEESTLKDTRYELLLVVANQGYTGSIMDAARTAGAGGGTVIQMAFMMVFFWLVRLTMSTSSFSFTSSTPRKAAAPSMPVPFAWITVPPPAPAVRAA